MNNKKIEIYVKSENIKSNHKRVWGSFKLSDKTVTKFEMLKGESWFQWNNSTNNLCITVNRVEHICNEWLELH